MKNKFYIVIALVIFFSIFFAGNNNAKAACEDEQEAYKSCLPPTDCTSVIRALDSCKCYAAGKISKINNNGSVECVSQATDGNPPAGDPTVTTRIYTPSPATDYPILSSYSAGNCGDNSNFTKIGGVCFPVVPGLADPSGGIAAILSNVLSWLLGIFTTIAIIAFVISGIMYLTSTGDTEQIEKAKNNAKYALLGVIVGLSGFIVLKAIQLALSGSKIF